MKQQLVQAIPVLRAFARSLTGDRASADDLVQETIVKALANQDKFQPGTNLHAWLITILRNQFYSEGRKKKREVMDSDGSYAARLVEPGRQTSSADFADFLRAMQALPDSQREALILIGASGFSYDEAAAIVGISVGTVKSRVSRARARLQEMLGDGTRLPGAEAAESSLREIDAGLQQRP